jgi:signal transduction histidine kinase/sensor domain CHASE-containing protein
MKLTKKISLFIVLLCILFSVLFFLLYQFILGDSVKEQKNLFAKKIIGGVFCILESEMNRITILGEDWASSESIYGYLGNPSSHVKDEMPAQIVLKDADLNLFLLIDGNRAIVNLNGYHHIERRPLTFDFLSKKKGPLWKYAARNFNEKETATGIVRTENGPMLVVSSPIIDRDNSNSMKGRLLIGRLIDKPYEERISKAVRSEVRILTHCCRHKQALAAEGKIPAAGPANCPVLEEGTNCMIIRQCIKDADDNLIFTLKVATNKKVFELLDKSTRLFFILLITGFVFLGLIFYLMMNRLVVRRVKRISTITNNIVSFDDLSQRIAERYRDEITLLSQNINQMLERLQTENIKKEEVERMAMLNEKLIFLGRMTANVTHEINNPLFAIDNSIRVIRKHMPTDNGTLDQVVQVVEKEITRVKSIVRNMHKYTMPNMDKSKLSDISSIVDGAVKVLQWSDQVKETVIDYKKAGHNFSLYCDPEALLQVFVNIMLNAVEAMEGKGRLVIDVFEKDGEYRVDFIDNGPGFSDEIKLAMFQPFKSTKSGKGTGLGLNISYHIVTNHGGAILLDDTYNDGAHVIVKLPAEGDSKSNGKSSPTPG